jgi:GTPase
LIAAFRATLEEVQEAALILQVTDISNPDHAEQDAEVRKVLAELGVGDRPVLQVMNKIDRLSAEELDSLIHANGNREEKSFTSALSGAGLDDLRAKIDAVLPTDPIVRLQLRLPISDGRHLSMLHAWGRVLHSEVQDGEIHLDAELPESLARKMEQFCSPAQAAENAGRPVKS